MISDVTLSHGTALGEGHERCIAALVCGELHGQVDHADLGAVAVTDDHLIAFFHKVNDRLGGALHQLKLLFGGLTQSVAAQCYYNSLCHRLTSESHT